MAIRKNVKRIDPRYFLEETTYRDNPDRLDEFGPGASNFGPLYPFEKSSWPSLLLDASVSI